MDEFARDPSRIWKILAMAMAVMVVILCALSILLPIWLGTAFAALAVGTVMCAISGIMALVKGRQVLGYSCSVFAGVFLVLLLFWVLRSIL